MRRGLAFESFPTLVFRSAAERMAETRLLAARSDENAPSTLMENGEEHEMSPVERISRNFVPKRRSYSSGNAPSTLMENARPGCKLLTIWPAMAASLSFLVPRQHRWTSDCLGCSHFLAPC
jgi:hypothetical protein